MSEYYRPDYNVLYISHLDEGHRYWILPVSPATITDTMTTTFQETNALGRSAPVLTYSNSGPRTVQISLKFRIDEFDDKNRNNPTVTEIPGEYLYDDFIRALQSIALPKYDISNKAVEPPLVALRLANEVFIKGVINSNIGIIYSLPIIYGNRYSVVEVTFTITEVDPYDAATVFKEGSFRGVVRTLRDGMGLSVAGSNNKSAATGPRKTTPFTRREAF
jgi:hypothetical protein